MPTIDIRGVTKRFGTTTALDDVSLSIPQGAFVALLGPSGCGKTTLLRLIAGFEEPTAGSIALGERVVADGRRLVPPEQRAVGMVFQSYALWPHMSVAENVAYPLRSAGRPGEEIAARVAATLARVGLTGLGERTPDALSGGQRQRVALARALVQDSDIILCDEPLANLDAHLRATMIETFAELHRDTGRTFVYVTHDHSEALALATQVAVLDHGRIVQVGGPEDIYGAPATRAVARFIGRGALIETEIAGMFADGRVPVRIGGVDMTARAAQAPVNGRGLVLVRPEAVKSGGPVPIVVERALYRGAAIEIAGALPCGQRLVFDWPERVAPGTALACTVTDAWLLPHSE
jgi:iron(III) transport system ATP-binding protein